MLLGIDHLVIAIDDPDAAAERLARDLGLAPGSGGRHDRLGTFNRLVWLGDTYIELVGVFDRGLASSSWLGVPALGALEGGGGLATWAVATDAIHTDVTTLRGHGSDLAAPIDGERVRPDGRVVRWRLAIPPSLGADRPPFLIEHDPTGAEWTQSERAERAAGPARLTGLELLIDDVDKVSRAMLRSVGLRFRPSLVGSGARDTDVGPHVVRLRPARGAGVVRTTIHLRHRSTEARDIEAFGCRWVLAPG